MSKKTFQTNSYPLFRPGLKDKQANYWTRTAFQKLIDYNGPIINSRYYTPAIVPDLRPGHRAVDVVGPSLVLSDTENAFALLHVHGIPESGGVSELPLAAVVAMGSPISVPAKITSLCWDHKYIELNGPKKDLTEAIFFNEFLVGPLGSVSFLGDLPSSHQYFKDAVTQALVNETLVTAMVLDPSTQTSQIVKAPWNSIKDKLAFVLLRAPLETAIVDAGDWLVGEEQFVFLATTQPFAAFEKNLQYTSSFFKALQHNPMQFFPDENYRRQLVKRARKLCTYWGGLAEILDFTQVTPEEIPDLDFISTAKKSPTRLTNAQLAALSADSVAYDTTEGKLLLRIKQTYDDVAAEIVNLETAAAPKQTQITRLQNMVNTLQKQLDAVHNKLLESQAKAEILSKEFEVENQTLMTKRRVEAALAPKLVEATKAFDNKIVEVRQELQANPTDFEGRLEKLGVVITDAVLRRKDDKAEKPLVGNEDLLTNEDWYLGRLCFITTRPHAIYVDRLKLKDKAPVIVGGPYEVSLSYFYDKAAGKFAKPQMSLRLASIDAVFGKFKKGLEWKAKIHPHTQPSTLQPNIASLTRFVENAHNVCLGEAETIIAEGFRSKDIWVAISACLSWIISANTEDLRNANETDEFGAAWTWFPAISEISMTGRWTEALETAEEKEAEDIARAAALAAEEEDARWAQIVEKLQAAGIPIPPKPGQVVHNNTGAAAALLRARDVEDNFTYEDSDQLQS